MKHPRSLFVFLSLGAACFITACSGKTNLQLKVQDGSGPNTATPKSKVEGAFLSPNSLITDVKKMNVNTVGSRYFLIQKTSMLTSFLCVEDLLNPEVLAKKPALKILAGSQFLIGQDVKSAVPAKENKNPQKPLAAKEVLHILCDSYSQQLPERAGITAGSGTKLEALPFHSRLFSGQTPQDYVFQVSIAGKEELRPLRIACLAQEKIVGSEKGLSQYAEAGADLILLAGSKIYFRTDMTDLEGETVQQLVVSCDDSTEGD